MYNEFCARIEWIPFEKGGRNSIPPIGTRYCPIIRTQNNEGWSIDFTVPDSMHNGSFLFHFLSDSAPGDMICVGKSYDVYEGLKKVARIYITAKN